MPSARPSTLRSAGFLALALASATPAAHAAKLHVPKDFPTIQQAIDAAAPGDVILVAPGTYPETLTIEAKSGLTLRGKKAKKVIVDGGGAVDPLLQIGGSSQDIAIERLTFRNAGASGLEVSLATGVSIRDCRIEEVGATGLLVGLATGVEVRDTILRATGQFGVTSVANGFVLRSCRIEDTGAAAVRLFGSGVAAIDNEMLSAGGAGFEIGLGGLSAASVLLADNRIEAPSGAGIDVGPGASDCLLVGNDIRAAGESGVVVRDGSTGVVVAGNAVRATLGSGLTIEADLVVARDNVFKKTAQLSMGAGIEVSASSEDGLLMDNRSKKSLGYGFLMFGTGHTLVSNVATKSAVFDLFDPNPAGENLYLGNIFGTKGP